ncbi:matrixin family metalloprotease [Nocardioides eburneiflavus]|uniref:Matrixin family metalloprotease n=1 Tax=Nocardioides eburneiflavus TaxID=2518372 RepID=A0A4Z1CLV9_9ACTN|nr:matrixin family metalloprotease [Nocardioides eburneiflavus]TGN62529.1 matrixin family metalloprotease [Nocardioides eburneiflavus]
MSIRRLLLVLALLLAFLLGSLGLAAAPATSAKPGSTAGSGVDCNLPESDAEELVILNYYYPNKYVWDDTHLTVGVQAAPNVSDAHLAAVRDAIESWDEVLRSCFDGEITLTDVTGSKRRSADIVLHYVPHAGGVVFAGYAICGATGCGNIIVSSEFATEESYTPEYLYYVTLHELGHALGLGHATNLLESTDLMGYGWIGDAPDPLFSQCDLDALAYLFGPVLAGTGPAAPGPSELDPTFDCSA